MNPAHLRDATNKQNQENRTGAQRNNCSSGIRGVYPTKCGWTAKVQHNGQVHYVGHFKALADAEAAVIAKRNELYTHNDLDRAPKDREAGMKIDHT